MGEYARVESFEALKRFRAALCQFADSAGAGLDEAEADIQRTAAWLSQEQSNFWKREGEKRAELFTRAKSALNRKKLQSTALGNRPSCVDEEKELARATQRLEEARVKAANVRRWCRLLTEEAFTYQAVAGGLSQVLAVDVPNALAQLDNMIAALEAYAATAAPQMQGSLAGVPEGGELGAGVGQGSMARGTVPGLRDVDAYRGLRVRTPPQSVRDTLTPHELDAGWQPVGAPASHPFADLASLGLARVPVEPGDKIVLARGVGQQPHLYLERLGPSAAGDSGWYVGGVDDSTPSEHDAVRVADLLAARPELEPLLELPAGCLIVLDGATLEAVFDAGDNLLWSARAVGPT